MGNRDTAKTRVPNTKKRIPKQNKNIRNGIFMPPPAGMEAIKGNPFKKMVEDDEFLNVLAKKKKGGVKSARSLLTSD